MGDIEDLDLALESQISKCTSDLDLECSDSSSSAADELLSYKEKLEGVLKARVSLAVDRWDYPAILRFIKLFKPLDLKKQGLQIFVSYLRKVVSTRAADQWVQLAEQPNGNNPANYEACLKILLGDIVSAIDENGETLRDLCGEGGIVYAICELHKECDSRGSNILKKFMDSPVYSYKEHLPEAIVPDAIESTKVLPDRREIVRKFMYLLVYSYKKLPDLIEIELHIDGVLPLVRLCEDYMEYMKSKIRSLTDPELESKATDAITMGYFSQVSRDISNFYVGLEGFFMAKNVLKAIHINERKPDSIISPMVDDVFSHVLWISISRAISTSSTTCVKGVLNHAADLLTGVYSHAVKPKLGVKQILRGLVIALTTRAERYDISNEKLEIALIEYKVSFEETLKVLGRIEEQSREKAIQITFVDDVIDALWTSYSWEGSASYSRLIERAVNILECIYSGAVKLNLENVEVMQTLGDFLIDLTEILWGFGEEAILRITVKVDGHDISNAELAIELKKNEARRDISTKELAIALNNYEVSIELTSKLQVWIEKQCRGESWELNQLASVREHLKQCLIDGKRQLVDTVKFQIKSLLESVETIVYDGYPWVRRLIDALDTKITRLKPLMTATEYDALTYHVIRLIIYWFLDKRFTPDFLESKHEQFSWEFKHLLLHLWSMAPRHPENILDDQVEHRVLTAKFRIESILRSVRIVGSDDQAIYANEANPWTQRIIGALETYVALIEPLMSAANYDKFSYCVIVSIVTWLRDEICTLSFNEGGDEQLLKDVSKLDDHLSRVARRPIDHLLDAIMEKFAANVLPRLKPILESLKTIGSDDEAVYEKANTWVRRLINALETNVASIMPLMSAAHYDTFSYCVIVSIVTWLRDEICTLSFNEGRHEQLLKDVSKLADHLSRVARRPIDHLLDAIMEKFAANVIPRLEPILESVKTIGSDDEAVYEEANTWVQRLIDALETNVARFKPLVSATSYDTFAYVVIDFTVTRLDRIVISLNFSEVPLEQLREDIEKLASHLASMTQRPITSQLNTLQCLVGFTYEPPLILRL